MSLPSEYLSSHFAATFRKHWRLQVMTIFTVAFSFVVAISVFVLNKNLNQILTLWGEDLQLSVYLQQDLNPRRRDEIEKILLGDERVKKVEFISKQQALGQFQEQMASYAPDLLKDPELLSVLPESFQVSLKQNSNGVSEIQLFKEIKEAVAAVAGVEQVSYGQEWVQSYSKLLGLIQIAGSFFIIMVLVLTLFVMSHFIQRSVHQRRAEIEVLELIGATTKFIRTPFLFEGAVHGLAAAALGIGFSGVVFLHLKQKISLQLSYFRIGDQLTFLSVGQALAAVLIAVLLGVLASYFSVRAINSGWAAASRTQR
jgi:cell division transport system permease protein